MSDSRPELPLDAFLKQDGGDDAVLYTRRGEGSVARENVYSAYAATLLEWLPNLQD